MGYNRLIDDSANSMGGDSYFHHENDSLKKRVSTLEKQVEALKTALLRTLAALEKAP